MKTIRTLNLNEICAGRLSLKTGFPAMFTRESTEVPICRVDLPAIDKGSEAFMCVHRIYKHGPNVQVGRLFAAFICAIHAHFSFFLFLFLRRAKHITGQPLNEMTDRTRNDMVDSIETCIIHVIIVLLLYMYTAGE